MAGYSCDLPGCDLPVSARCNLCGRSFCVRHIQWIGTYQPSVNADYIAAHYACDECWQREVAYNAEQARIVRNIMWIVLFPITVPILIIIGIGKFLQNLSRSLNTAQRTQHNRAPNPKGDLHSHRSAASPQWFGGQTKKRAVSVLEHHIDRRDVLVMSIVVAGIFSVLIAAGIANSMLVANGVIESRDSLLGWLFVLGCLSYLSAWVVTLAAVAQARLVGWFFAILFLGWFAMLAYSFLGKRDDFESFQIFDHYQYRAARRERIVRFLRIALVGASIMIALFLAFGGFTYCSATVSECAVSSYSELGGILAGIAFIILIPIWLLGLIASARNHAWIWFGVILLFSPMATLLYGIVGLKPVTNRTQRANTAQFV